MEGHWANRMPCYRCRFPWEYAITNKIKQTQGEYTRAVAAPRESDSKSKITRELIVRTIENLGDMVKTPREGAAGRESDVCRSTGLRAEFDPGSRKGRAEVSLDPAPPGESHGDVVGVRGGHGSPMSL